MYTPHKEPRSLTQRFTKKVVSGWKLARRTIQYLQNRTKHFLVSRL